jgi:hypothetical protein
MDLPGLAKGLELLACEGRVSSSPTERIVTLLMYFNKMQTTIPWQFCEAQFFVHGLSLLLSIGSYLRAMAVLVERSPTELPQASTVRPKTSLGMPDRVPMYSNKATSSPARQQASGHGV